jgi:predicted transposase YbfD/YdcC
MFDSYIEEEIKHKGRIEQRVTEVFEDNLSIADRTFKSYVEHIIKVTRKRQVKDTKTKKYNDSSEIAYYISTVPLMANDYADIIRGHWGIENCNHHVRDETLKEDKSRIRKNPVIMATLRSFVLNIMRANKVSNISSELYRNICDMKNVRRYRYLWG